LYIERFPFLKDAPVEGEYTNSVKVNFKPMGIRLRNVRCLRCGEWGHQSGDRECALKDFNPHGKVPYIHLFSLHTLTVCMGG
jgi:CBF1 interacting corepressor